MAGQAHHERTGADPAIVPFDEWLSGLYPMTVDLSVKGESISGSFDQPLPMVEEHRGGRRKLVGRSSVWRLLPIPAFAQAGRRASRGDLRDAEELQGPRFFRVPARNSGLAVRGPALDGWWAMQGFCLLIETALQWEKGLARAVWSRCRAADGREFQVGGRSGTVLSINNRQCFKYVFFR